MCNSNFYMCWFSQTSASVPHRKKTHIPLVFSGLLCLLALYFHWLPHYSAFTWVILLLWTHLSFQPLHIDLLLSLEVNDRPKPIRAVELKWNQMARPEVVRRAEAAPVRGQGLESTMWYACAWWVIRRFLVDTGLTEEHRLELLPLRFLVL